MSGSGSAGGRSSSSVGFKRLRDAAGSLASPAPFAGFGSPASMASSAAAAARLPTERRGGRSGPPGKVPCMCGVCPGVGNHRLPTLALVQKRDSAVRAWLRAIGTPWKPLAERYAAATAAGRPLTLRVADGHWHKWTRGAVPDRIYSLRVWTTGARPGRIFGGGTFVSSLGRATPAEHTANATRRLRSALATGRMDRVAEVAEEHAGDLDAANREIDDLRAQVGSLERSLSVAEARVDADARLIVDFRGLRLPAFRFANIKGNDALCQAVYGVTGDVVTELAGLLRILGYNDVPQITAKEFHLARSAYTEGTDRVSPDVAITVQGSDMIVRQKSVGGTETKLDVEENLAWTFHSLRGDVRAAQAEPVYAVSDTALGKGMHKILVSLDNLWPTLFPPLTYGQALELTPLALIARLFGKGSTGVPVSAWGTLGAQVSYNLTHLLELLHLPVHCLRRFSSWTLKKCTRRASARASTTP